MPLYVYTALSESGTRLTGEIAAVSQDALRSELASRGLLVQDVRPKRSGFGLPARRTPPEEIALFNQEFTALIRAGLTIPDALALAANRPDSPALGKVLVRVHEDVRNGVLLSEACDRYSDTFDRLFVAALRTGEKAGNLPEVLSRYQGYLRHRVALRKKLAQAIAYPIFLLVALVVIMAVLFAFVLPRFVAMYADLGAALPLPTRILIGIVNHLYIIAPILLMAILLCTLGWRRWIVSEAGRRAVDELKESIPYIGSLTRIVTAAQLSRSLATLLAGGTPLVEALRTASGSIANQVYLDRLAEVTRKVIDGSGLANAVRTTALMPEMAVRMIEVGEASGGLDGMFTEVANFYEEALDTRLTRVMSLVEPLLMLLMGVLIGAIIIVMYLPVFHMADIIR